MLHCSSTKHCQMNVIMVNTVLFSWTSPDFCNLDAYFPHMSRNPAVIVKSNLHGKDIEAAVYVRQPECRNPFQIINQVQCDRRKDDMGFYCIESADMTSNGKAFDLQTAVPPQ